MKNIFIHFSAIILVTLLTSVLSMAQQSMQVSHNYDNQFLQNPAATSLWNETVISGYYSRAFNNVPNAPTDFFIGLQYPIAGQNAAIGFSLTSQSAGLLSIQKVQGGFAYKIRGLLNRSDYLSLGLGMKLQQIKFKGAEAIVIDQEDPNYGGVESGIGINFQSGALYSSSAEIGGRNSPNIIFQIGTGMNTIKRTIDIRSQYKYEQQMQFNGFVSVIFAGNTDMMIRSYVETLYDTGKQFNVTGGVRAILADSFIAGISFDNVFSSGIEFGYLFPSTSNGFTSMSVQFNMAFNDTSEYIHPGLGVAFTHSIEKNRF